MSTTHILPTSLPDDLISPNEWLERYLSVYLQYVTHEDSPITGTVSGPVLLDTPVYDDLQFAISGARVPAANYPSWETFTTNTMEYAFGVNEYIDTQANELPHWWKEGTTGHAHVHFTLKSANNSGANRFVKISAVFAYADSTHTWSESPLSEEYTIPTGTAALTNAYLDLGNLNFTGYKIGTQIKVRVRRIAATGGVEYADDVFITQVGIHLEKDALGSSSEGTK